MILIFGGRHDPNIGVLTDRLVARDIPFIDLRIGPDANPRLRIDLVRRRLEVDGDPVSPAGCFLRHDVFLYPTEDVVGASAAALNWYQAVRGWVVSQPWIRVFNRLYPLRETNKIGNMLDASACGLGIPPTVIDSHPVDPQSLPGPHSQKPVAGGRIHRAGRREPCDGRISSVHPATAGPARNADLPHCDAAAGVQAGIARP